MLYSIIDIHDGADFWDRTPKGEWSLETAKGVAIRVSTFIRGKHSTRFTLYASGKERAVEKTFAFRFTVH